jgi:hypothetical protein
MCVENLIFFLTLAAGITSAGRRSRLARMVSEDLNKQFVGGLLELVDNSVVQGVLVLLKPSSQVVGHLFHEQCNESKLRS